MRSNGKGRAAIAALFALLAVLFHLFVALPLALLVARSLDDPAASGERTLEVIELEAAPVEQTPTEQLADYEPREEIPDGEVVRAPEPRDKRPPVTKPRFLAEHDSRTDRETRAWLRTPGAERAAAAPSLGGQGADPETAPGGMRDGQMGVGPMPMAEAPKLEPDEKGTFSTTLRAPFSPRNLSLTPSREAIAGALAGSGLDNLEDVIDADATVLNTAAWDYASFFNRVKDKVERYWQPGLEYRRRDPYGNVYGMKDRVTVLLVVLNPSGDLHKLYVMDPSGAPFLDDEAYEAVEQAAPFPNVPPGLRGKKDGLVKFTFHFIVEVGEAPIVRMRRYE